MTLHRRPLQLVIFDCDGVLVDSERLAVRVEVAALAELGLKLTEGEVVERFLGRSYEYMVKEVESELGHALSDAWQNELRRRYREAFDAELRPVDGVVEALDRITTPTSVASSGTPDHIRHTLGLAGLYERFEGRIFSASEVANGKPAPDLFLYAAERLGVEPSASAVVEDSRSGVEAARAAGMRVFGYAGGVTAANRLAGPDTVVFDDMRQLPDLLGERVR